LLESKTNMVESTPAGKEQDFLAPNIAVKDLQTMTEYERRMARAARYGLDASKVIGPQATLQDKMKPNEAFDRMAQGPKVV